MKTIDLLAQALPAIGGWPEKVTHIGQDYDRELMFYGRGNVRSGIFLDQLAADHRKHGKSGTKITREQYEAALAAKNDGWIGWGGGEYPPVSTNAVVDVKLRCGSITARQPAGAMNWQVNAPGDPGDIIAYRLHQPQEADRVRAAAWNAYAGITEADEEANLNECIGQDAAPVWNGEGLPPVGVECEYSWAGEPWASGVIRYISKHTIIIETQSDSTGDTECAYHPTDIKLRPFRTEDDRKRDEAIEQMIKIATMYTTKSLGLDLAFNSIYNSIASGEIPGVKLED